MSLGFGLGFYFWEPRGLASSTQYVVPVLNFRESQADVCSGLPTDRKVLDLDEWREEKRGAVNLFAY